MSKLEKIADSGSVEEKTNMFFELLAHPSAPYLAAAIIAISYVMPSGSVGHYLNDRYMEQARRESEVQYLLLSCRI